jgi:glycosyltransferase involved in cell wall biosynthesis
MISIGLPVYNGEQFLLEKFDSLLSQTFQNFEIIVSDNASTDATKSICESYLKKDFRIKYFKQEQNFGAIANYNFVLEKANGEYFVWTAVDDIMEPNFLEKLIQKLQQNEQAIACMSNIKFHGITENNFKKINKFLKNIGLSFRPFSHFPIHGRYETRVNLFLKKLPWHLFYAVYKTEILKKTSLITLGGFDALPILNSLKYGDIEVVNDVFLDVFACGRQSEGMIQAAKRFNNGGIETLFLFLPLTREIRKSIGKKLFYKNILNILRLNFDGVFLILLDVLAIMIHKFSNSENPRKLSADY